MTSSYKEVPQWNKRIKPFKLKLAKGCEQANRRTVSRTLFASKSPEVRFQRHLREGIRNDVMCEWLKAGRLFSPEGNGREQHGPIKHNASHTWVGSRLPSPRVESPELLLPFLGASWSPRREVAGEVPGAEGTGLWASSLRVPDVLASGLRHCGQGSHAGLGAPSR